jgi:F-type H+-transporting ATPase subunit delta
MESVIAGKYAVALLQVAEERKVVDAVGEELKAVRALVESNPALKAALEHPRAKSQDKLDALRKLLGKDLSEPVENLLSLLLMKKRIQHFRAVADHYERLCLERKGRAVARVVSAMPLEAGQRVALEKKLTQTFGVEVEVREEVRPGLIGGMMVYLGDQRMDGSVLGQLERMKQRMMKVEIE